MKERKYRGSNWKIFFYRIGYSISKPSSPGHGLVEHRFTATDFPKRLQFLPPYFGSGLLHARDHVSKPWPQVTLHVLFNDQLP